MPSQFTVIHQAATATPIFESETETNRIKF